jgi:hypothetical protein
MGNFVSLLCVKHPSCETLQSLLQHAPDPSPVPHALHPGCLSLGPVRPKLFRKLCDARVFAVRVPRPLDEIFGSTTFANDLTQHSVHFEHQCPILTLERRRRHVVIKVEILQIGHVRLCSSRGCRSFLLKLFALHRSSRPSKNPGLPGGTETSVQRCLFVYDLRNIAFCPSTRVWVYIERVGETPGHSVEAGHFCTMNRVRACLRWMSDLQTRLELF